MTKEVVFIEMSKANDAPEIVYGKYNTIYNHRCC